MARLRIEDVASPDIRRNVGRQSPKTPTGTPAAADFDFGFMPIGTDSASLHPVVN